MGGRQKSSKAGSRQLVPKPHTRKCVPPWERLCWGQCPVVSSPSIQASHPHSRNPLPACRGNMILALCRLCWQPQPCPVQQGPLTHPSAVDPPRSSGRALLESCFPGEHRPPPRPSWAGLGVSPPFCRRKNEKWERNK